MSVSSVTAVGGLHGMYKTAVPAGTTGSCAVRICTDCIELITHYEFRETVFSSTLPEVISVGLYLSEEQTLIPTPPPMSCTDYSKHGCIAW